MSTPPPTSNRENALRTGALAFLEGTRTGWSYVEITRWARHYLLRRGYLTLRSPLSGRFALHEPGPLPIELSTSGDPIAAEIAAIVDAARRVTLASLRALLDGDDRFLQGALFAARVSRKRTVDTPTAMWLPTLQEGMPLSDMVLALVSADMLRGRADYDEGLVICDECDAVRIDPTLPNRRRCTIHAADGNRVSDVVTRNGVTTIKGATGC